MTEILAYDEDVAFTLADGAATVSAIVRRAPDERLRSTRFGEWSAKQVIGHLADSAELFADRVRRALEEDMPHLPAWDGDAAAARGAYDSGDAMEMSRRIQRAFHEIVTLLQRPGAAQRPARHADWGVVPAGHLAAYQAKHSHDHVAELQRAFPPASA